MLNRLEMIKQSLRISYSDDDSLLSSLDSVSQEYVGNTVEALV